MQQENILLFAVARFVWLKEWHSTTPVDLADAAGRFRIVLSVFKVSAPTLQ